MLISFLFLFFSFRAQKVLWKTSVSLNQYGWLPFDYNNRKLIYFSNNTEYKCSASFSTFCDANNSTLYIPITYIMQDKILFVNVDEDIRPNTPNPNHTCIYYDINDFPIKSICLALLHNTNYVKQFQSISANDKYFYSRSLETSEIFVYQMPIKSQQLMPTILKYLTTTWYVRDDGLYSFQVSNTEMSLTKYYIDGSTFKWKSLLPLCQSKDSSNDLLVSSKESKVFVICSANNLLTIINSGNGNIISQYAIDKGKAVAIECTTKYLFILYGDGSVAQYTLDFNFVYIYRIDNMKTPKYAVLKVDNSFLFHILCSNNSAYDGCLDPFIYQWSVQNNVVKVTLNYEVQKSEVNIENTFLSETTLKFNTSKVYLEASSGINTQNSYFTPVIYRDLQDRKHILYYSGGGDVGNAVCGDIFMNDLIFNGIRIDLHEKYSLLMHPIQDYAAFLKEVEGRFYYFLHGGLSCDYETIYSDLISIDIESKKYSLISQNISIP
jgi:hypothetical protein